MLSKPKLLFFNIKGLFINIVGLFLVSCNDKNADLPNPLLTEAQMVDILYDLSIVDAIRLNNPAVFSENKVSTARFIFEKHQVDSLIFASNNQYYAGQFEVYIRIYDSVYSRLDKKKLETDSIVKGIRNPLKHVEVDTTNLEKKGLKRLNVLTKNKNNSEIEVKN
jgi:hypothetical protein